MKITCGTALLILSITGNCLAADRKTADQLVSVLRYEEVVDYMAETCLESAQKTDVEADLRKTPGLFGEISPQSPVWEETKEAYLALLRSNCFFYNKERAIAAFTEKFSSGLSNSEIEAVLAFYRTPAGQKFRDVGILANNAAKTASVDPAISQKAYELYREKLQDLLRRHHDSISEKSARGAR